MRSLGRLGRTIRLLALGLLILALAPSASATTVRYTFEAEVELIADAFFLPGPDRRSLTIVLEVEDTDLDPSRRVGRFHATRVRIAWDSVFPAGAHFSFDSTTEPVFEVRVGADGAGDLTDDFVVQRINFQVEGQSTVPDVFLKVTRNDWLALRNGPIKDDALPRSLDLAQFESDPFVDVAFNLGILVGRLTSASVTVVPEPATAALFALGIFAVAGFVRRRRV